MTENKILGTTAATLAAFLQNVLESIFGPHVHMPALGPLTWADLGTSLFFLLVVLMVNVVVVSLLRRHLRRGEQQPETSGWRRHLVQVVGKPIYALIWVYGIYLASTPVVLRLTSSEGPHPVRRVFDRFFDLAFFAILFWLFFRSTQVLEARLTAWASKTQSKFDDVVVLLLVRALRIIVPVLGLIFALPLIGLSQEYSDLLGKGSSILIICAVAWILSHAVHLGEKAVLDKYDITAADNLQARKVYTQVHVLSKTLYFIIAIFTVASILMLFDQVRRFGTSLLASAGVVGVIAGFAAQRTIANLFAGFQLAMTQPIRLDDVVIVEGEWGRIEEITLTYVVIHIWDDRRLIVPLSTFIEKPFQNWTRVSAQLLGSVFVWADYSLPLDQVRQAVKQIVEASALWDKRFWNVQVTDASERTMQIRVLATAADSSKAWDLRCEVREKLIAYIQQHHPGSLPRLRGELDNSVRE
jgi:small-conductance mechanosensitive channel